MPITATSRWAASPLIAVLLTGCPSESPRPTADPALTTAVDAWHEARIADLKSPTGWLSLVGLEWLDDDGAYSIGGPSPGIPLPRVAAQAGTIMKQGPKFVLMASEGSSITVDDVVPTSPVDLRTDAHKDGASVIKVGETQFHLIDRAGRVGARIKDPQSPARTQFKGVPRYPVGADWRVTATITPHAEPKLIQVPTVLGTTLDEPSPGSLSFELQGQVYTLDPMRSSKGLFIVYGDQTNGVDDGTYGGGRFLSATWDGKATTVELDFNRSINPPCAFTPYATCPLPPKGNRLAVAVTAGEKVPPGAATHE